MFSYMFRSNDICKRGAYIGNEETHAMFSYMFCGNDGCKRGAYIAYELTNYAATDVLTLNEIVLSWWS